MFTYKIIDNFLSKSECDEILNFSLKNLLLEKAKIADYLNDKIYNENKRKSELSYYNYFENFPFLYQRLIKIIKDEIEVKGYDLNLNNERFQFTKYQTGDYFNWHKDKMPNDTDLETSRYCSLVIQLNNNYTGGNLEFKADKNIIVNKGIGNLIIFLSEIEHRVTNVESGERYTLVNWVSLKKNKNFEKTLI